MRKLLLIKIDEWQKIGNPFKAIYNPSFSSQSHFSCLIKFDRKISLTLFKSFVTPLIQNVNLEAPPILKPLSQLNFEKLMPFSSFMSVKEIKNIQKYHNAGLS